ncbi:TonB-dependent receptor [Proteiniphilum sp. X52]|uniref:SusC/RagA family TonB-linked outer membrane protein n=1 Tax=Proteiniphilum sp. X52 TaxID=2382159 RepID=UPI000F09D2F7|nr:TonB-dependent receptor [Proteiniphilum sp. X52]RNC64458.1 TonB-dependent receptor [Proteiniphilum sp. X52]
MKQVMSSLVKGMLFLFVWLFSFCLFAQNITVKGKVTDGSGEPLIGVTVQVRGTSIGTVTDMDGNFTLPNVPGNATLEISYVGMVPQRIAVDGRRTIAITMTEDVEALEEVVVVGYGTQKAKELTGSVVSVKGEQVREAPVANVLNTLAGTMAGVTVNTRSGEPGLDNPSILIRGKNTLGNNAPLIIIDGVPRDGLERLNPNDIENITVLKDATAAIYGARAANGVILVETRSGKSGKATFNFSYNMGFQQDTRVPNMADAFTFATIQNEIETLNGRPPVYTDEVLELYRNGTDPYYPNTDWYSYITKKFTPQNRLDFSVDGGNENTTYRVSLGRTFQDGHYKYGITEHEQYNLQSKIDATISKNVAFGLNLRGTILDGIRPYNYNDIYPHIFLYHPTWFPKWPGTDYMAPGRDNDNLINRVSANEGYRNSKSKILQSTLTYRVNAPWVEGLCLNGSFNYDYGHSFNKTWYEPSYVYYRDEDTGEYTRGRTGFGADDPSLSVDTRNNTMFLWNVMLNYEKQLGQHSMAGLAGYEQMTSDYDYLLGSRSRFVSTKIDELFAGTSDRNYMNNDGSAGESARINYFGRLSYNYAQKYLLQFTFRYDGSQNFPRNKRFGFFPGVSAGWNASEEAFMSSVDFISYLKLKASYGRMGNDNIPAYQYLAAYGFGSNYVIGNVDVNGLNALNVPNPNITWEIAKTFNFGMDFYLWNALRGEINVFHSERSNILTKRSAVIPEYTGLQLPDENIGIVRNRGIEVEISYNSRYRDIEYFVAGNFSFNRNKVIFTDEAPMAEAYQLATGRPLGSRLLYKSIGIFKDWNEIENYPHLLGAQPGDIKYEDVNKDGEINSLDQIRINETADPEIIFGLNAGITYKNFNLSILLQGQENANFLNTTNWTTSLSKGAGNYYQWRVNNHWTPENRDATMPRSSESRSENTQESTHWLLNAGFLRLKNLELGYNLPSNWINSSGLQNCRIYLSGHNLFLIYDHMKEIGYDPEVPSAWYYPQQRVYNIGINLTF